MKKIKNMLLSITILLLLPLMVNATTSKFEIKVNNLNTNAITGTFAITNGQIKSITMMNGWENKTGLNNSFYFTSPKIATGSYVVAIIEVEKTGNLVYQTKDLTYHYLKCEQDKFGAYFDNQGTKVDYQTYKKACNISSNANLKSLKLSTGTLSPDFNAQTTTYTATVPFTTSQVNLIASVSDSKSSLNGDINCKLNVGKNTCKLTVTAEDKTTKTYTVNVTREANKGTSTPNNPYVIDTSITNFEIVNATLEETFDNNIKDYNIHVNKNAQEIYFKFKMNGISYQTKPCTITTGTARCSFTVTSYDSTVKKTYNFYIIPSNIASNNQNQSSTKPSTQSGSKNPGSNTESNTNDPSNPTEEENNNVMPPLPETEEPNEDNDINQEVHEKKESIFKSIDFKIIGIVIVSVLIGALLCIIFTKWNHKRKFFK